MENKIVYLQSGQEAELVKEIDGQYLVKPYYTYYGYEGEEYSEPSATVEVVDKVFSSAPTPKFQEKLQLLKDQIKESEEKLININSEVRKATLELDRLKNNTTDVSKYIINRQEIRDAKRITYFSDKGWLPNDWTPKSSWSTKISATIEIRSGKESFWMYKLCEGYDSSSDYIDHAYGILIDKTDEEIEAITKERIARYENKDHLYERGLTRVDDKYLTPTLIEKKNKLVAGENEKSKIKIENEIESLKTKLSQLNNQLKQST